MLNGSQKEGVRNSGYLFGLQFKPNSKRVASKNRRPAKVIAILASLSQGRNINTKSHVKNVPFAHLAQPKKMMTAARKGKRIGIYNADIGIEFDPWTAFQDDPDLWATAAPSKSVCCLSFFFWVCVLLMAFVCCFFCFTRLCFFFLVVSFFFSDADGREAEKGGADERGIEFGGSKVRETWG